MEKIIIKFGDIEIEKQKFHQRKRAVSIKSLDINKIVVSNKVSFGKISSAAKITRCYFIVLLQVNEYALAVNLFY